MQNRVRIAVQSDFSLPTWAITHYLQQTEINYLRLVTTEAICRFAQDGHDLDRLVVATESAELFQRESPTLESFRSLVQLTRKEDSADRFWKIIARHARPMVFVGEPEGQFLPLYDFLSERALVVRQLNINSPFDAVLEGLAGALPDLIYAREREGRARVEWQNEQNGQAARNLANIVRASQVIESPTTPPGVRHYAQAMLDQLMENQVRLNAAAGVTRRRIDQLV